MHRPNRMTRFIRAFGRAMTFFLKVFPQLPSRPVDWVTAEPVIEKVRYPTRTGESEGEIYRPPGIGPHPGIVVCLGVVPFEVDHPQVPVLGRALARAGFVALLYWSPAMRDFRLDPADVENISLAYGWMMERSDVDPARSGLLGTCVGGSFALMAAATPQIADRVNFVSAYAPFSSMSTFVTDIASSSKSAEGGREPWQVDPLTRKVFVHSLTGLLDPAEAETLRTAFNGRAEPLDDHGLSVEGRAVFSLLAARELVEAETALQRLPPAMRERLASLSPLVHLPGIRAPLILLLHDRGDNVVPVGESRRLVSAFSGRAGVHYTEMEFQHLDPVRGNLPLLKLLRELGKFFFAVFPCFDNRWPAEARTPGGAYPSSACP